MAASGGRSKRQLAALPDGTIKAVTEQEAEAVSTIKAVAKLHADGIRPDEIALALSISRYKVDKALKDPRMRLAVARIQAERAGEVAVTEQIAAAQAEYRLARAWEVLDMELESKDPWIRHQAALAIIAAANRAAETASQQQLIIAPELIYDDQDLQDKDEDSAFPPELTVIDAEMDDDDPV